MSFISKHDKLQPESIRNNCKATLHALLTASEKPVDNTLRERIRMYVRMAMENGFSLNLSDATSELGKLMSRANVRSHAMGWL